MPEEEPRRASLASGLRAPRDRADKISTSTRRRTTVSGGRQPQNLHYSAQLKESEDNYDPDAAFADKEEDGKTD